MPKIPSADNINRISGSGQTSVVSLDSRRATGGLSDISDGLSSIDAREANFQTSKADLEMLKEKHRIELELDSDPNFDEHEQRYQETLDKKIHDLSVGISNPRIKAEFINRQKVNVENGLAKVNKKVFMKRADREINSLNDDAEAAREMYLNSDPEDVAVIRESLDRRYDSLAELGMISETDAGNYKRKWKVDAALARIEMMEPEDQIKALNADFSKNIPSDQLKGLKEKAKAQIMQNKAIGIVDGFISKDLDESDAREKISKINNPDLRKQVESRWDYEYNANKRADAEEQWQYRDKYGYDVLHKGLKVNEIDPEDWENMSSETKIYLTNAEAESVKPPTKSDPNLVLHLSELAATEQWDKLVSIVSDPNRALSAADRVKYGKIKIDGTMPEEIDDQLTDNQAISTSIVDSQIEDENAKTVLLGKVADWRRRYIARTGKKPDDRERQQFIDDQILKVPVDGGWFGADKEIPYYQLKDDQWDETLAEIKDEDPDIAKKIIHYFRTGPSIDGTLEAELPPTNPNPSKIEILRVYNKLKEMKDADE